MDVLELLRCFMVFLNSAFNNCEVGEGIITSRKSEEVNETTSLSMEFDCIEIEFLNKASVDFVLLGFDDLYGLGELLSNGEVL